MKGDRGNLMKYQITNGTVSLGGKMILDHIDFTIKGKEKIAVVGRNGAGKTTLLRVISEEIPFDRDDKNFGNPITKEGNISIGFLHQQSFSHTERTVEEEILSLIPEKDVFSRERYDFEQEYDQMFTRFGFAKTDKKKKLKEFSGGEQTKIAMICLLLSKPDLLLLDEPTNHLDLPAVEWLEEYLASYNKAVVIVSHDRFFLDRTVDIIYELSHGKLVKYVGNYSEYRQMKEKERKLQQKNYDAQQKEITRLTELIEKFKHKPKKASMARSKKKVLERMQKIGAPSKEEAHIFKEKIEPFSLGSKHVLETDHLMVGYDRPIREITFRLRRGQKTAILGANGSGKSTFVQTISGKIPAISGKYHLGKGIHTGYFDQHSGDLSTDPSLEKRVGEHFGDCFPMLTEKEKRKLLACYLFSNEKTGTKVSSLSGGEKSRLLLAEILESRPNFLILDEPTNHMDLPAKETLESAFLAYTGTILFISHDRYFVSQIADSLLVFEKNAVKYYPFGYEHYLSMKKKQKEGLTGSALVEAENTALVEGLLSVPAKERHQSARFNTEQSYTDWQLSLAAEQLKKIQARLEDHLEAFSSLTPKEYETGSWQEQTKQLEREYEEKCLLWYEKWQEYEEAFDSYREDI